MEINLYFSSFFFFLTERQAKIFVPSFFGTCVLSHVHLNFL